MDVFLSGFHLAQTNLPTLVDYFIQSNFAGQVIIFFLFVCSVVAWSVMVGRSMDLDRIQKSNLLFEERLAECDSLAEVDLRSLGHSGSLYAYVLREALSASSRFRLSDPVKRRSEEATQIKFIENALHRAVAAGSERYERRMLTLGTIVSSAPFLGLLGTVWGVMEAFGSVATTGTATLQALAPGVSGALLTTVAALVVAIPSVVGYNYLLSKVRRLILELENFASSLADRLELEM